ncbi:MAG: sensor histidine kinase, partial [Actinomycetota bacterium]|nr:sensor histidine kinase [Actinomycetota bacterium]
AGTVPLAWRRRFPLAAMLVVVGSLVVIGFSNVDIADPMAPFLGIVIAMYSVGAHAARRRSLVGLGLGLALAAISVTVEMGLTIADYSFAAVAAAGPWLAGAALRGRRLEADEAHNRAKLALAEERSRIARELHDVVAHSVSVMTVQAGAVRRLLTPEQERERETLLGVERTGREALNEMRRLLGMLRATDEEQALAPQPSLRRLDTLVDQVRHAGLPVELRVEGTPVDLPPGLDLSAYRIVQEALTNTLKHAGPARAAVVVRYGSDALELEVADDGRGAANGTGSGAGLVGMRERAALVGGRVEAGPGDRGGYSVRAHLPLS